MCGFVGFISNKTSDINHETVLNNMLDKIINRGPDDKGTWVDGEVALGHRRLSIQDTSLLGHQPMHSSSNRFVTAFNGEIYNFLELKAELIILGFKFKSDSDTEVLLAACEAWGVEASLKKFTGMFAFALWDKQEKKLYLARDRMGEKPLYYAVLSTGVIFGSQLSSLVEHPCFKKELDRDVIGLYLRHGYIPAPYSIYKNTAKLMPAKFITFEVIPDDILIKEAVTYWYFQNTVKSKSSGVLLEDAKIAVHRLDKLINKSVEQQSKADVPLGAFLSGGIDSSLITAYMQSQSSQPINTFTIGFNDPKYNEAKFAKKIARHLGTKHTEYYIEQNDLLSVVPKLPSMFDEPFADSSQLPTYVVGSLAKQKVTVALSGDGGDELFCGYGRYEKSLKRWAKIEKLPLKIRSLIGKAASNIGPINNVKNFRLLGKNAHELIRGLDYIGCTEFNAYYKRSMSTLSNIELIVKGAAPCITVYDCMQESNSLEHMMYTDTLQYLPDDILVKIDRAFMASSLEGRIPLLDHHIVAFAKSISTDVHRFDGRGKYLLRELLYKKVPKELIERPKMGFAIPLDDWLRDSLKEWANDLLCPARLIKDDIFDVNFVTQLWNQHKAGVNNWGPLLWSILMFNAWVEEQ